MDKYEKAAHEIVINTTGVMPAPVEIIESYLRDTFPPVPVSDSVAGLVKGIRSKMVYGEGAYTLDEEEAGKLIQAYIDEQLNKWIPVTERRPEVGGMVIVCYEHGSENKKNTCIAFFNGTGFLIPSLGMGDRNVTLWQPLPEAPK